MYQTCCRRDMYKIRMTRKRGEKSMKRIRTQQLHRHYFHEVERFTTVHQDLKLPGANERTILLATNFGRNMCVDVEIRETRVMRNGQ